MQIPQKILNLNDYINFRPTYLYLKRHKKTNLLYFGKTCNKDVLNYKGSGKYWLNHIKKYGETDIETLWFCLFTERDLLYEFAISYSKQEDINNNPTYANMILEEGFNGGTLGHKQNRKKFYHTEKSKENRKNKIRAMDSKGNKMGLVLKSDPRFLTGELISIHGNIYSKESIDKRREARKGYKPTEETKAKTSKTLKGRIRPKEESEKAGRSLKGRAPAKSTLTGEYIGFISIEDERWKTGEIISNFKGRERKKKSSQ